MCGIAGIVSRAGAGMDLARRVGVMVAAIRHRGPDGVGEWLEPSGQAAFGHARLAIIDLSEEGRQPMSSSDGGLVLTFNGEIYNHVELRRELLAQGAFFRGTSDTEVLLEAMRRWGVEAALKRARGMFALGLWDARARSLWLARDRVGKKPLYVRETAEETVFASEMKALLADSGSRPQISSEALSDYLSLGFVLGPRTIHRGVTEIRPGTLVRIGLDGQREERIYWSFPGSASRRLPPADIERETARLLDEAVKLRLRADVPVGVFLSGGIDSGLITALASRASARPLKTFTVTFGAAAFDETPLALSVAKRYATEHEEIRLDPDLRELLPRVAAAYDEPFGDPSALPTFAVSQAASRRVKVVLNGEGADELFGGYRRIYAMKQLARAQLLVRALPAGLVGAAVGALPLPRSFRSPYSFLHRFLRAVEADPCQRYLTWSTDGFDEEEKRRLGLTASGGRRSTAEVLGDALRGCPGLPPLAEFMALDFLTGMTDCLLPKIDIATMAHGLEGRSPFLDQELVSWVAGLDKRDLLTGRQTKPVLRNLARKLLPAPVAAAPKRGFEIPLIRWMKEDLRSMTRDICASSDSVLFDLLDRRAVMGVLDRTTPMDDERWAKRVWLLFMLAAWGRFGR